MPNPRRITPDAEFEPTAGERLTLFNAGGYTVVSGVLRGDSRKRLLQRCEHPPKVGCPSGWHVVPEFLEIPLLHALLDETCKNHRQLTNADLSKSILEEIKVFYRQKSEAA